MRHVGSHGSLLAVRRQGNGRFADTSESAVGEEPHTLVEARRVVLEDLANRCRPQACMSHTVKSSYHLLHSAGLLLQVPLRPPFKQVRLNLIICDRLA